LIAFDYLRLGLFATNSVVVTVVRYLYCFKSREEIIAATYRSLAAA